MLRKSLLASTLFAAALLSGCGEQTLVAGVFLNTPAIANPIVPGTTLGPYSAMLGYVVQINTSDITDLSSASVKPVTGVMAEVSFESCMSVSDQAAQAMCVSTGHGGTDEILPIPESSDTDGLYQLLSTDNASLTFEEGVTYTMILQVPDGATDTDAYGARFQPGPPAHMVEFADKSSPVFLTAGTDLTVHRDDAKVNGEYLPAAMLVGMIDPANPTAEPTVVYKSLDYTDPKTLALYALSDEPYRVASFDIPGTAFATAGFYVVTMVAFTEGKASENAFIGSTALAGSGDVGLVVVQ